MDISTGTDVSATLSVSCDYSAAIKASHAHPTAFYLVPGSQVIGNGVLEFHYKWLSDSGNMNDILPGSLCYVTEYTTYNGNSQSFHLPNEGTYPNRHLPYDPPYSGEGWLEPNPTTVGTASNPASNFGQSGQNPGIHDAHMRAALTPATISDGPFVNNASQVFKFHCSCMIDGEMEKVPGNSGPFLIERSVYKQNGQWYYKVSKHGYSSTTTF